MKTKVVAASRRVVGLAAVVATLLMLPLFGGAAPAMMVATGAGRSSCTRTCGNVSIQYPFGVEPGCYLEAGFNLTCDRRRRSHRPPRLFLGDGTVQVLDISVPNATVRINSIVAKFPGGANYNSTSTNTPGTWGGALGGEGGPYSLARMRNKLVASGCNVQFLLEGDPNQTVSACSAFCNTNAHGSTLVYVGGHCSGIGCCQAEIFVPRSSYRFEVTKMKGATSFQIRHVWASIVESEFNADPNDLQMLDPKTLPAVLDWRINHMTCHGNKSSLACRSTHSFCANITNSFTTIARVGHVCHCAQGYQGNPYIPNGCNDIDECNYPDQYVCYGVCKNTPGSFICQCNKGYTGNASVANACTDIDECKHKEAYSCYGTCQNFPGSFHCQCPEGTHGNSSIQGGCITIKNSFTGLSIGLGVGGGTGLLLLALGGPYIMRKIKLQKVKNKKQRFFEQNHGLLLQRLISHNTNISERMIITLNGIEKATNNFDRARIIGGGGHGVVFKGILDLQVVAVKKSKILVQREINGFINEVAVLSQVNHRNVVKLLGCCLETEVPLLVYEFISNGTLCHHLHVDGPISLPWDDRMRIATEVAKALSYLHSATSVPIFHRDIKSTNILLDDALTAKVSDFGASKYIPTDQTGVTTAVQGTMGYLDPMYFYTSRLTDKSDVFSFGVLLVELITRKKPYVYRSVDNDGLVSHFVSLLAEGKLVDIIDPQVMKEEGGEIREVATLAALCTKLKGEDRPTMREVEMTLESLLVKKRQVRYNGTPMRTRGDEATTQYMAIGRDCSEASRQYTMEEEILLSTSYPR